MAEQLQYLNNKMYCFVKPKLLDKEQIKKCVQCKHISAKKLWCCKWGFWVQEKKVIVSKSRIIKPPTMTQMAIQFTKAMAKWAKKGFKCVSKDEYLKRRAVCAQCVPDGRCPHCGCYLWAKVALVTEKCPEGKW